MDMNTLCAGIRLPQEVFQRVKLFLENCDWNVLDSYVQAMTVPESAERSYKALWTLLGEDDMGMLACQLSAAVKVHERYREIGISDDIYYTTMACFARFLEETKRITGKWCYDRAFWSHRQTSMRIFRIAELEYELCCEKQAVSVHIPTDARFTPEAVDASLEAARNFLAKYFPQCAEYSFICHSWLLSPELARFLLEGSNILSFQRRFEIQSVQPEEKDFFQWLFEATKDTPVEMLPENSSLQRSVKRLLLEGGNIGAARGVMMESGTKMKRSTNFMEATRLAGLEPASVFGYFEKICSIPHGSRNTKMISDYLVSFAVDHGLKYIQDEANNVILFGEGTCGMEDHEPVILQGHMDMVCEKDADCPIDMATEGLDVTHDGTCVYAKGTTLGGDDGIALAYAMALLADDSIPHPPLEVIITVDEEVGMLGADVIDLSMLKGKTLINLDSEDEGIFTVSCAGGATATISLPAERRAVYGPCIRLAVDGLQGGHSGAEIHKNRANANKVMGEFMNRIQNLMPLCLTSLTGGSKDNAIPRSCQATMVAMGIHLDRINAIAEQLQAEIREQYDEPEATVQAFDVDALGGNSLTTEATARVIALLCAAPNGVQSMSEDMPELVQTSLNLGIAKLGDRFTATFSVRSSINAEKQELLEKLKTLAEFHEGTYSQMGEYPAWEFKKDSVLRDTMVRIYEEMFEKKPQVLAIHAGLECGLLGEKLPGLDCVSIGPQMHDIHTSRERLEIASTERTWKFLLEVLKEL